MTRFTSENKEYYANQINSFTPFPAYIKRGRLIVELNSTKKEIVRTEERAEQVLEDLLRIAQNY